MVNYHNYLSFSQDDINKRLLNMIFDLQKSNGADESDIKDLKDAIGKESEATSILGRIKALEDAQTPANESTPTT